MAIKELKRFSKNAELFDKNKESKVEKFISKGGSLPLPLDKPDGDHRLTLRIPKWLMARVDEKRKERVGKISRNLWILEVIEKASKK